MELPNYRIKGTPSSVYYIPDFISEVEEAYLRKQVYLAPRQRWVQLRKRRLQSWGRGGGTPSAEGMALEALEPWLTAPFKRFERLGLFKDMGDAPNHVLINEYLAGQGIMPHEDGAFYHPTVATVSLGSHTILDFYPSQESLGAPEFSLLLEPRSLVVLTEDVYLRYKHGIAETTVDDLSKKKVLNLPYDMIPCTLERTTRLSLTYRSVKNANDRQS
ncbi:putative alpha-ketoglutarate-dependent dioxygenase ABH6-like protein [Basidiobolus meristosporus CBS 931.73]|uniref:Putative alpha-ketoglutarate-dependent dioxygenase ABH6-like protein n=1 Tax=Basidiobolus meristosporus CBS 931.73 TaxID=1314790 RepID=A0A1Y1YFN1_9FUNG|nr:putative alpha-ketoglutarate-dependent dioxygenase ABH6-like protein [Basidiobolus meristosporus CBS 931.73]|eukprot:ORX96703.1 putative alpha-ketoglutarate-dependent dioxygenase ABH6-like protein [Basidiobolus meristosporus CBS 931.73]